MAEMVAMATEKRRVLANTILLCVLYEYERKLRSYEYVARVYYLFTKKYEGKAFSFTRRYTSTM